MEWKVELNFRALFGILICAYCFYLGGDYTLLGWAGLIYLSGK
jgi:hypothetical protein